MSKKTDAKDEYTDQNFPEEDKQDSEFARMFEASVKTDKGRRFSPGDKLTAEILVMGKDEVFVSLGSSKDGIVYRRDLADAEGKVVYKVGDKIDLYVTQLRGAEVYLSPKPTAKNLAEDLEDAFDMELPVEGKVAEVCNGGFRVQLRGKLAFCPISQMDTRRIDQPEIYLGQRYEFRITKFEEGGRNIVVSRRRVLEAERELSVGAFTEERKVGDIVQGKVARLEKFGAFIEIAPGVDGLAHVSELSWSRVNDPSEVLRVGQDVTAKILKIEMQEGGKLRISLSLKQVGGVALIFNTVSLDSEDGPACAPVLSAYFLGLATGEGRVYPLKDYDAWFEAAGFRDCTKYHMPEINHGLIVATK